MQVLLSRINIIVTTYSKWSMKHLRHYIMHVCLFTVLSAPGDDIKEFEKHFKLMPRPQKIEMLNEKSFPVTSLRNVYLKGISSRPVLNGVLSSLPLTTKPAEGMLALT